MKTLTDTDLSIGETEWQAEYHKSKYISNPVNKPLKIANSFLPLQERKDDGRIAK